MWGGSWGSNGLTGERRTDGGRNVVCDAHPVVSYVVSPAARTWVVAHEAGSLSGVAEWIGGQDEPASAFTVYRRHDGLAFDLTVDEIAELAGLLSASG